MEFKTLDEIKRHKWVGNHFSDSAAFDAIDKFIKDRVNEAGEAIRVMSVNGMGIANTTTNENLVIDWLEHR